MICFDMDGVLAIYERDAYDGDNPRYIQPGYFRTCKPDKRAIELLRQCMDMLPLDTFITTGVRKDYRNQMIIDKIYWISEYIPEFDIGTRFIANSEMDKSALFEHLRMSSLNRYDILIDDYNPRLYNWTMRGGTAIKWLNNVNSESSWNGMCLNKPNSYYTANNMFMQIMGAMMCK